MKAAFAHLHGQSPQDWHVRVEVGALLSSNLPASPASVSVLPFSGSEKPSTLFTAWPLPGPLPYTQSCTHTALGRLSWGQPSSFEAPYFLCRDSPLPVPNIGNSKVNYSVISQGMSCPCEYSGRGTLSPPAFLTHTTTPKLENPKFSLGFSGPKLS